MALTDSLISYWALDEASGNRADSHGSNTLTDGNSVGSGAGKIGTAADFESGSTDYLFRNDNADLSTGDVDWSLQAWVNLESKPANLMVIAGKHDGATVAGSEYLLYWDNTVDRFRLAVYGPAGATATVTASTFGAPSTGTWYLIHVWHDATANEIGIAVNAGSADTASFSAGCNDTAANLILGTLEGGSLWYDGLIDEVGFWKRVLTSGERTQLYNGGSGLAYPFAAGGGATSGNLLLLGVG